jgi:acetylornithine deacetylase/succinyl-diaminopimelate desuccinylase-like protein
MRIALAALLAGSLFAGAAAFVQLPGLSEPDEHPRLQAALDVIRRAEPSTLAEQVRLCEVPAPTFAERARAEVVRDLFAAAGLKNVRLDREGNVIGERPGRSARPHLVLAAHLDTVFPEDTPVKVRREGMLFRGPGISDNCRGLAVLVAIARALSAAGLETEGSMTFAATVAEEGLGDLRGVRALLLTTLKGRVDHFVAVDGSGTSITNIGVGSRRYLVTFRGSGGHSFNDFGRANPAQALGRAMALMSDLPVPSGPKTTFNVGRIGGGTSINAIPVEAWMEVDLRSTGPAALDALDRSIQDILQRAAALENDRWGGQKQVTVTAKRVGDRPAGRTDERSAIVQAALAASRDAGMAPSLIAGSTDANVPMQMKIPAISVGAGGRSSGVHTVDETFDSANSVRGTERALRLAVALSTR